MESISETKTTKRKYLLLLFAIISISIILRLYINFETKLMPGVMATYYPIQVRSILDNGRLGLPDLPFVFYFEALIAKILIVLNLCSKSTCIMASSKITDAVVYPLIGIPFYYLSKLIASKNNSPKWIPLLITALVTISIPALVMMADFQKNSIGLMWAAFYVYFLFKGAKQGQLVHFILALAFFLLTGLTHLGGLGFVILFTLLFIILSVLLKKGSRKKLLYTLITAILSITLSGLILYIWDKDRFIRLIRIFSLPAELFSNPMILGMFTGDVPPLPHLLINVAYAYIVCILGILIFIRKRLVIIGVNRVLFLTSLIISFVLSFPLLDEEWATRLYLMAYIPASIVLIFILSVIKTKWKRNIITVFMLISMLAPLPVMWKIRKMMCITEEAYEDLYNLKPVITEPEKSIITARHGLEWWASWVLETDISHGQDRIEDIQDDYDHIYYLVQISGHGEFGQFGPGQGPAFPEPEIPDFADVVYQDEFYILAKVNDNLYNPYPYEGGNQH